MKDNSLLNICVARRFGLSLERMKRLTLAGFVGALLCGAAFIQPLHAPKEVGPENRNPGVNMKIVVTSVMVNDQDKALKFYTEVLGFVKKTDIPMGGPRWLTVVSPEQPDGPELLLEPMGFAPAKTFQKALFDAGIPLTSFAVEDVEATYQKLKKAGVVFRTTPTKMGPVTVATFEDTCGNLIQIAQK